MLSDLEQDVLWKELHHEACQEVKGESLIEVLLLPELISLPEMSTHE